MGPQAETIVSSMLDRLLIKWRVSRHSCFGERNTGWLSPDSRRQTPDSPQGSRKGGARAHLLLPSHSEAHFTPLTGHTLHTALPNSQTPTRIINFMRNAANFPNALHFIFVAFNYPIRRWKWYKSIWYWWCWWCWWCCSYNMEIYRVEIIRKQC